MLEWIDWAADQVDALARADDIYREFARKQSALVDAYEAVLAAMPEIDRELLLDYMTTEGEMQYRKTQIAYEFGKQVGRKQTR